MQPFEKPRGENHFVVQSPKVGIGHVKTASLREFGEPTAWRVRFTLNGQRRTETFYSLDRATNFCDSIHLQRMQAKKAAETTDGELPKRMPAGPLVRLVEGRGGLYTCLGASTGQRVYRVDQAYRRACHRGYSSWLDGGPVGDRTSWAASDARVGGFLAGQRSNLYEVAVLVGHRKGWPSALSPHAQYHGCRSTQDGGIWVCSKGNCGVPAPVATLKTWINDAPTEIQRKIRSAMIRDKLKLAESGGLRMYVRDDEPHDVRPIERHRELLELRWTLKELELEGDETVHLIRLYFDEPRHEPEVMRGLHAHRKVDAAEQNLEIDLAERVRVEGTDFS